MAEERNYIERKFGYCKVHWNIGNYCVTPCGDEWNFYSPEFYVRGIYVTKWRMMLRRTLIREDNYDVVFGLERLEYGSSNEDAVVDCSVEYSDHGGETIEIEIQYNFQVNSIYERELNTISLTPVNHAHSDLFHLKCEILVKFDDVVEELPAFVDVGINKLSDDLLGLYLNPQDYDLQFAVDEDYVSAHKCICYYRIPDIVFRNKFSQVVGGLFLIDDYSRIGVDKILKFLYSGKLELAVTDPVISAYKFAELLDIHPVINYYDPDEHDITSNIDVEEFNVTWTIENFSSREDVFIRSPRMNNGNDTVNWHLKVYPRGYGSGRSSVGLFLEIEVGEPTEICVEFFVIDTDKRRFSHRHHKRIINKEYFGDKSFMKCDSLTNYLVNGNLTIGFRLRIPTQTESFSLGKSKARFEQVSVRACYERYVADLLRMYEDQAYQDFRIQFQSHIAYLHKCVLKVRYQAVSIGFELDHPYFRALKSRLIKALCFFLYTGGLARNLSLKDTFQLYGTADIYGVTTLKLIIINKLQKCLSESNARRICQFAEAKHIVSLVAHAQTFM